MKKFIATLLFVLSSLLFSAQNQILHYYCGGTYPYIISPSDDIILYSGATTTRSSAGNYVITVYDSTGTQVAQENLTQSSSGTTGVKWSSLGNGIPFGKRYSVNVGVGSIGSYTAGTTTCTNVWYGLELQMFGNYCGASSGFSLALPIAIYEYGGYTIANDNFYTSGYGIVVYNCNSDGTQGSLVYSSSSPIQHANTGLKWGDLNPGAGLLYGNSYYVYFGAYQNGSLILGRNPCTLKFTSWLAIPNNYSGGSYPIPNIATTPAYIADGFQGAYGYANDTYYPGGYAYSVYAVNGDGSKGALISTVNASHAFDPTFKYLGNVGLNWNTWYYINVGSYQNGTLVQGFETYKVLTAPCSGVISTNLTHTNTTCQLANGTATSAPTGGNSPYTYSWSTTPTCTASTASNIYAGTYSVTVTDSKNCTATSTVTLTNTGTSPTVTVNSPTVAICNGTSTTLTLTGSGTSYSWTPSAGLSTTTGTNVVASPTTTTIYTITATLGSCTAQAATSSVTVNPTPTLTVNTPTVAICNGNSTTLTVTGSGTSYSWTPSTGLSATTGTNVVASPTATTVYTVTATLGSCTAQTTSTVTVNPTPTLTVNSPTVAICNGNSTTLTATGNGTTYSWTPSTGLSATTGTNVVASPTATTVYTVTATLGSCTGIATSTVTINSLPTLTVTLSSNSICIGNTATLTASGASIYAWSPSSGLDTIGGATVTASPITTTTYTISGTDANSCVNTTTFVITVNSLPTINIAANPRPAIYQIGKNVTLTASGASTYSWSPSSGLNTATSSTVVASPTVTTIYTVTATDANTCVNTQTISILYSPLSIAYQTQNILPNQLQNSGYIITNGLNGFPPYHYLWADNASTQNNRYNLTAGSYALTIVDSLQDTLKQNFTIGNSLVELINQNISDSNNIYTNTSYSTGVGNIIYGNSINADEDGYMDFVIADTSSKFFLGFGPLATDSTEQSYTGFAMRTKNKYISRSAALMNTNLLATYDTLASSYSDSIKVVSRMLVNVTSSDTSATLANLYGLKITNNKLYVFMAGSTYQKAISLNSGDVLRIGRSNGSIYVQRNSNPLIVAGSSVGSLNIAPHLYLNSQTLNHSAFSGNFSKNNISTFATSCSGDLSINYVYNKTYDENAHVVSESISYFDYLGRSTQSQARILSQGNTLVTQNLYDAFGRNVGQTLPAPNFASSLCYQPGFVTDANTNQAYTYINFDKQNSTGAAGEIDNPIGVNNSTQGTLGWYYSNNNTAEPYVATSSFPYSRVEYFPDPFGRTKRASGVGDNHVMGSGHESRIYYMSNQGELDYVYGFRGTYQLEDPTPTGATPPVENENLHLYKTITVNADGREDISYSNSSGQVIATCMSGADQNSCSTPNIVQNVKYYKLGFTDFHLPKAKNTSLYLPMVCQHCVPDYYSYNSLYDLISPNPSYIRYIIFDINTGKQLVQGLTSGSNDFYVDNSSTGGGKVTFYGQYATQSLHLRIAYDVIPGPVTMTYQNSSGGTSSYNVYPQTEFSAKPSTFIPELTAQYQLDYSNWSLNYIDERGNIIANTSPNDVNCNNYNFSTVFTDINETNNQNYECSSFYPTTLDLTSSSAPVPGQKRDISLQANLFINPTPYSNIVDPVTFQCIPQSGNHRQGPNHNVSIASQTPNYASKTVPFVDANSSVDSAEVAVLLDTTVFCGQVNGAVDSTFFKNNFYNYTYNSSGHAIDSISIYNEKVVSSIIYVDSLGNPIDTVTSTSVQRGTIPNTYFVYTYTYQISFIDNNAVTHYITTDGNGNPLKLEISYNPSSTVGTATSRLVQNGSAQSLNNNFNVVIPYSPNYTVNSISINILDVAITFMNFLGLPSTPLSYNDMSCSGQPCIIAHSSSTMQHLFWTTQQYTSNISINVDYLLADQDDLFVTQPLSKQNIYDKNNRLSATISTDEGRKDFVYDSEDKLRFSQDDKQRTISTSYGGKFSYINYDRAARPIETGEYDPGIPNPTVNGNALDIDRYCFQTQANQDLGTPVISGEDNIFTITDVVGSFDTYRTSQQTYSAYDLPDAGLTTAISNYTPTFLPGKVAKTWNAYSSSWYSYDELGRVAWTVQQTNESVLGNPVKTFNYTYGLLGNVLSTIYQKEGAEFFEHAFAYDADQRLIKASTGTPDSPPLVDFNTHDSYSYYLHGPLKREEIGTHLQGIDYVYTINGMLKGINHPNLTGTYDPGADGITGSHSAFNKDIFGLALDYYNNDYVRSGANLPIYTGSSYSGTNNSFAGQIKAMRWQTVVPTAGSGNILYGGSPIMYEYNYDDKYRLTGATFGTVANTNPGTTVPFTALNDYKVSNLDYDLNGNINHIKRYSYSQYPAPAVPFDDLTYNYDATKKNKLLQVSDAMGASFLSTDIDIGDQASSSNYTYNEIGQITANAAENTTTVYDVYGQVTNVYQTSTNNPIVNYIYNDKGLRAAKKSYDGSGNLQTQLNYMYDAAGSLVCTYETDFASGGSHTTTLKDYALYGGSRLGIWDAANSSTSAPVFYYEMNDHLGNVRAVYTANSNGTANVVSLTDYFPHGGPMPMRKYVASPTYRYDYQGQEKDAETNLLNFELRQYDPRLGRWFAPDPMGQFDNPYNAMGNNPVSMIDPDGGYSIGGDATSYNPHNEFADYMDYGFNSASAMQWAAANYDPGKSGEYQTAHYDQMANNVKFTATPWVESHSTAKGQEIVTGQGVDYQRVFNTLNYQGMNAAFALGGITTGTITPYTGSPQIDATIGLGVGLGNGVVGAGKDALNFGKGLFTGQSWTSMGNGVLGLIQTYRDAMGHDMESFDRDIWAKRIDNAKNASPEQVGYVVGYAATSAFFSDGRIGGAAFVDNKFFGAGSKLFGWGGKFKKVSYAKGILNNNNIARVGWQMTSNQTMRFGLRFGANPKYLNSSNKFIIGFNRTIYNSPLGHGLGSIFYNKIK